MLHIALGVDANYIKYAGVLMTNLVHQHIGRQLCLHLAVAGVTEEEKERLTQFGQLYQNVTLRVYLADNLLQELRLPADKVPKRLNLSVFLRVLLPKYLPKNVDKVIYMDVDMLCCGPLTELWQTELGKNVLAAVPYPEAAGKEQLERLGLTKAHYFNAGLMLINLKQWRKLNITDKVIEFFNANVERCLLLEQDCLNSLLDDRVLLLEPKYNRQLESNNPDAHENRPGDVVLHFVNESKPWTKGCLPEFYAAYWKYVELSLWREVVVPVEPTTVKASYLAGKNAEARGDWQEAAKYYGITASRLMQYYLYESKPLEK